MSRRLFEKNKKLLDKEHGTVIKPHAGKLRIALGYPNTYHIGMSNVGFQAVYRFWNELADVVCERVFLPEREDLKEHHRTRTPLFSMESGRPVRDFDVFAFSVTFEPDEINLLTMLDLAGIPLMASERSHRHPLVVVGGPITFLNPEPLAAFADLFAVGEAEVLLPQLTQAIMDRDDRADLLEALQGGGGFYVPSHYDIRYGPDGRIKQRVNRLTGRDRVVRAKMGKRADWPPPATYILTESTEMSSKFLVEVSRGCPTLCRFCWAGYNYLPKRSFEAERILDAARKARAHTDQIGLVSTAVGAHREIVPIAKDLEEMGFRVSVSSLRFEDLRSELLDPLVGSGEKTLAVAPEVGSDRLRFAIHKRISNEEILEKVDLIFSRGVENLKLYLMAGLPGETEEDREAIVELVEAVRGRMMAHGKRRGRVGRVIASINPFIPKPGTPFQWCAMAPLPELNRRMRYLKKALSSLANVEVNIKSPRLERLQAVLSLGDRRLAPAMVMMAREKIDVAQALKLNGLDMDFYIHRSRTLDEVLPWDHIDNGMKRELLVTQLRKSGIGGENSSTRDKNPDADGDQSSRT
jgi:radical SAM superfamily enzyme YgiQ (UPF0313 family)